MDLIDGEHGRERERQLGYRIREERLVRGISQERLAEALGVSFQQIQRYESGMTPISATRLQDVAGLLGASAGDLLGSAGSSERARPTAASTREMSELLRVWPDVPPDVRKCFLALARAVVGPTQD